MKSPEMGGHKPEKLPELSEKDLLIKSGIADRMVATLKKRFEKRPGEPEMNWGAEDCDFIVSEDQAHHDDPIMPNITIKTPDGHQLGFDVGPNNRFGMADDPTLTYEQMKVVRNILENKSKK